MSITQRGNAPEKYPEHKHPKQEIRHKQSRLESCRKRSSFHRMINLSLIHISIRQDQDGRMFLSKLYIAKQYRGRHLAAFLFDFLKNLCRQRNCSEMCIRDRKNPTHTFPSQGSRRNIRPMRQSSMPPRATFRSVSRQPSG